MSKKTTHSVAATSAVAALAASLLAGGVVPASAAELSPGIVTSFGADASGDANGDGYRYELVKVTGAETGKVTEGTTTVTFTYQKVANWVPTIPGMELPKIPYPFTPEGGTGEGVIPHVDGFVPVDPVTGEPLKPVDPEDPTKGYVPPPAPLLALIPSSTTSL